MIALKDLTDVIGEEGHVSMVTVVQVLINTHAKMLLNVFGWKILVVVKDVCTKIDVITILAKSTVLNNMGAYFLKESVKKYNVQNMSMKLSVIVFRIMIVIGQD